MFGQLDPEQAEHFMNQNMYFHEAITILENRKTGLCQQSTPKMLEEIVILFV